MVHGRTVSAFILKFIETVIWMGAIGTVVSEIKDAPILILFYSLGCSLGAVILSSGCFSGSVLSNMARISGGSLSLWPA